MRIPSLKPSLSWLLVFVPISIPADLAHLPPVAVFTLTCIAIIPLAGVIGNATEQLALYAGPRIGGLLNATFGNVTELIIGILLVRAQPFDVDKATLIGSILGNLVLVLGASYVAGGLRHKEQRFSARAAGIHSSSLLLAVAGLLMPAVFVITTNETPVQREAVSVTVAVVLMALYIAGLAFSVTTTTTTPTMRGVQTEDAPTWSIPRAVIVLLVAAVIVGIESEFLVDSLQPAVAALHISKLFVGLFIVAIGGNAAEHASAVIFAIKD